MDTSTLYLPDFPQQYKVKDVDAVELYHAGRFDELDAIIICKDKNGAVTATFGQSNWYCLPFSRKKTANNLNMEEFDEIPELQRELKLLTLGWLFNKGPKKRKALSFSGVLTQFSSIKMTYRFLAQNNHISLKALSKQSVWTQFERYLIEKGYAQRTVVSLFVAINGATHSASWHKLDLGLAPIKSEQQARRICTKTPQQTLVIPERLCHDIYGKAIELLDEAYPYRHLIADTEKAIQDNYFKGKCRLDNKVKYGTNFTFMRSDGNIDSHKYAIAIKDYQPQKGYDIVALLANKIPNIALKNVADFRRYLGQLITASYIICGGFSGMRDSELDKLTPDSYYKDTFDGRDYHMLQSHSFKLGEKRATWITSASSKLAIELMDVLTKGWRKKVIYPDDKYVNSLWVHRPHRSKPPTLVGHWPHRLKLFCSHFHFTVTIEDYQECIKSNPNSLERIKHDVKVGQPWPLSSHQFRRTLAFYCINNRLGTLVALKQQFKHTYLAMTEWYSNGGKLASLRDLKVDEQVQKALDDINAETTANKIFKQWHSDETLSGTHGKAIMKMRGDVPTIYSSWDVIYKAVKDGKLTLHGSLHSYCKSGYDCDMDGVVAPQFCVDCGSGSSIIDEQQAKWWQKKHRSLVAYMESGEEISVSEQSHYITQVRAAEKVMADFDTPFTPFEPELKVAKL
ncbi:site-specific integrase [Shewanella gaetbuli]